MFEQAFRNIDDVLRKEAGCTTKFAALDAESAQVLQTIRGLL
jgi:hypothetical protein